MTLDKIRDRVQHFGWMTWLGISLVIIFLVMTIVALVTPLGNSVVYVTFISHVALIITGITIIQTARVDEKADKRDPNIPDK